MHLGLRHQSGAPRSRPATDWVCAVWAIAVDAVETAWVHEQRAETMSLVTSGGGLVFGDVNGRGRAFDQETGDVLWKGSLVLECGLGRCRPPCPAGAWNQTGWTILPTSPSRRASSWRKRSRRRRDATRSSS